MFGEKKILFIKLQGTVSVADIVLWAALYPVLSDSSISLGKYKNLFLDIFTANLFILIYPNRLTVSFSATVTNYFTFLGERMSVRAWFERGANMHSFQAAAQKVLQGKGLQGMKGYLQRQPIPQSSQCREMQPCTSNPTEVLDGSLKEILVLKHLQKFMCMISPYRKLTSYALFKYFFRLKRLRFQKRRWRQLLSHGVKSYTTVLYLKSDSTPCESPRLSLPTLVH